MRRKIQVVILLALTGVLASAGYVLSQQRGRLPVARVEVPVNVRDARGDTVPGLTRDDFIVLEDGRQQPITSFSADPLPLSCAILIDDGMGANALKRLIPLLHVMTSGFAMEDEMVAYRYDHFVWKLSDFTNDHAVIEKSFNELARIADTRPPEADPGQPAPSGPGWLRSIAGLISIGSNGAPKTVPSAADPPKRAPTSRLMHDAVYEAANGLKTRSGDRRKLIMLVSDGQVSGANTRSLEKNNTFLLQNQIQVYAIGVDYALREGTLSALANYAHVTGGDTYPGGNSPDMEKAFLRITEQARNQYVLGYTSDTRSQVGVYHAIDVKTTRPGLKVTHRKGYTQFPIQ